MSIYGTDFTFALVDDIEEWPRRVMVQVVASFIADDGPDWSFLPPPRLGIEEEDGYEHPRAAVFVLDETEKGTERNGQEYVSPLLTLTGEEYETLSFREVMGRLEDALAKRLGRKE